MRSLVPAALGAAVLMATANAQDFDAATVRVERVRPNLDVLFTDGGNVGASNVAVLTGEQGAVIADTGFAELVPKYRRAIEELGGGKIAFAIDTHWHDDHAAGNKALGPAGTHLVAHAASRLALTRHNAINVVRTVLDQPAYPAGAVPSITFEKEMRLHVNGETVDLLHVAPAHTAGDAAVFFRGANAVHLGDVFNNMAYPFVDHDNGGSLDGMIEFCERVLAEIDEDTVIIPGHGPLATYRELADYIAMLKTIRERIGALIAQGATLEQVTAARPTAEWDAKYGNPRQILDRVYANLRAQAQRGGS